jgi:tetratricopeptide (TPR) repeat protein
VGNIENTFINREDDISVIKGFVDSNKLDRIRFIVLQAQPASGLTMFLRYSANLLRKSSISLYVDCQNQVSNNLFSQLILGLFNYYKSTYQDLANLISSRIGINSKRDITLAALSGLPYVGPMLQKVGETASTQLQFTHYGSAVAEVVCEFIAKITKENRMFLFLDNAQSIDNWSMDLLTTTIGGTYNKLKFLAGFVLRPPISKKSADEFILRNEKIGYQVECIEFPLPDSHFVKTICQYYGIDIDERVAASLVEASQGNVYRLRSAIKRLISSQIIIPEVDSKILQPIMKRIIGLLYFSGQAIRKSDISALCLKDKTLFIKKETEIDKAIELLLDNADITVANLPDGDILLELRGTSNLLIEGDYVSNLNLISSLYEYFLNVKKYSKRHSQSELAPLLFRLSKYIDQEKTHIYLQEIISLSLQMGSLSAAERFVEKAAHPQGKDFKNIENFILWLSFLVSLGLYDRVLELLSPPPVSEWSQLRICKVLKAISLNRCRKHKESEQSLLELCETSNSADEIALLVSYRIVGRFHDNDVKGAQKLFKEYRPKVASSRNYGYFLRNGAEVFDSKETLKLTAEALEHFNIHNDNFGYATTLCNRSEYFCRLGRPVEALDEVLEAYEYLEIFGIHYLDILFNSMGLCYLFLKQYDQAIIYFNKGIAVNSSRTTLPEVFCRFSLQLNLAAANMLKGDRESAANIIISLIEIAEEDPLDRIRQKYYPNAALIGLFAGWPTKKIREFCFKAELHPDRDASQFSENIHGEDVIKFVYKNLDRVDDLTLEEYVNYFIPCYQAYWTQNPIESFPKDILPLKATI